MTPIRVMQVIARMNVGGPAAMVESVARGLDPERFDHRLLVGTVGAGEEDYFRLRGVNVPFSVIPGLGRAVSPLDDARALAVLTSEIRRFRPEIVHTHTAKAGALGRVAARMARVPAVLHTYHGHILTGYFPRPVTAGIRVSERALAGITDRLVAIGTRVRDELLAAGIGRPGQYVVMEPGVSLERVPAPCDARRSLGIRDDVPVVAFVGRLTRVKRPDRLLAVARHVIAHRPDTHFIVCGDGTMTGKLRDVAVDLGGRVRFLGWRGDVATVYGAADVVVLTSDNEGMPLSLIEAAIAGRPAVTTDVGGAREVVRDGETGFVTSTDALDIARRVDQLLADAGLRHMFGAKAKDEAASRFSSQRFVEQTASLYASLVTDKINGTA